MKRSEKLLALALLACVATFVVIPWIWKAFRGPVAEQESALERATARLQKSIDEFDLARASIQSMRTFKEQSLSSNSAEGALAYQQWLTDLAEIVADFDDAEVTPERISPSRDNSYVAVRLRVTGDGTMEQLRTFLYRFHRANVLHRISSMVVEARNNSSRPMLSIRITTEAIALRDAPAKGPTLFPRTTLAEVSRDDGPVRLKLASADGFPETAPFELRVGPNYYKVADIDGASLQLDLNEGETVEAAEGDIVELSVVHSDFEQIAISEYDALIEKNPFAKPAPYRPRLDLIGTKKIERSEKMSLTAKVSGIDAAAGDVEFKLLTELPAGMTFDKGQLTWEPPADLAAGDYTLGVRAAGGGLQEPIESEFTLTLADVNKPPVVTVPDNLVATLGQTTTTKLEATDPETPSEELTFALADGSPEGAAFNTETRELTFTPPAGSEPGEVTIGVVVTDAGSPAQSTTASLKFTVQDDKAQFTFMEGVVSADAVPEAWLRDKSTNTRMVLHEGDDLKYAGFDAIVLSIGEDFLLMQQADETLRLNVGQNLRQSVVIAKLEPADANPSQESSTDDKASTEKPAESDTSGKPKTDDASSVRQPDASEPTESTAEPASPATDSDNEKKSASKASGDTAEESDQPENFAPAESLDNKSETDSKEGDENQDDADADDGSKDNSSS